MQTPYPQRWWALAALAVALVTFGLDVTILNVALPTLAAALHASTSQLQWFASSYTLVMAAVLLPAGMLGDRFGHKRILLGALALFGLASLGCAYADSASVLIAARALLGVAAAFMVPLSASLVMLMFSPAERSRAIAAWATAMSVGIPLGPVLGGWLLDQFWWGSVFLINVPLVAVGLVALAWLLPDVRGRRTDPVDLIGIVSSSLGLVALTYGLVATGEHGWLSAVAAAPILVGVALLALFAGWQRHTTHPLVDLTLFSSRGFAAGSVLATFASFALMGILFVLPQYFSAVGGHDALGTGLRLLPVVAGLLVGVQVAERARPSVGAKAVVTIGFALMTAGLVTGANSEASSGYGTTAAWVATVGLGLGFSLPPSIDVALGALHPDRSGSGSALIQALRQVGGTFGVAVLGSALNAGYRAEVGVAGLPPEVGGTVRNSVESGRKVAESTGSSSLLESVQAAFVHGMDNLMWVCAAVTVAGALLTLGYLPKRPADAETPQWQHDVLTE